MQIVYYYIEELNDIKQQNINFGDKYSFNYDPITKEFTAEENELYIENFYGDNINITAIIGENGSGKSSIINRLITHYSFSISTINPPYILILKHNNVYTIYKGDIDLINKTKFKTLDNEYPYYFTDIIFYSNTLNLDLIDYTSYNDITNISTNYLLNNGYNKDFDKFKNDQLKLFLDFILDNEDFVSFIKLPSYLGFYISPLLMVYDKEGYSETNKIVFRIDDDKKNSKYSGKINLIFGIALYYYIQIKKIHIAGDFQSEKKKEKIDLIWNEFLSNFDSLLSDQNIASLRLLVDKVIIDLLNVKNNVLGINTEKLNVVIDKILVLIDEDIIKYNFRGNYSLSVTTFKELSLIEFIQNFSIGDNLLFNVIFNNYSSGEYAISILFARFYNLIKLNELRNDNIIIFIDEIDLYFHPDWQKELITKLLKFFNTYFKDKKIHLIFTANNPLMISDILSYNTIFLQKVDNNTTIINNSLTDHKNTFAANIHTLLSDSFFMKNGTMGDFAKNKLNEIIDHLNNKINKDEPEQREQREKIKKAIKLIGEPIIRKKLMSMYNEFYGDEIISRLERLEDRLKRIEDDKN